jgi:cytochrome c oxidase subunit 2
MKRAALTLCLVVAVTALTSCSEQSRHEWSNFAMPDPGTEQAQTLFDFWRWSWIALLLIGVLVWGLIFWSVWVYRRRSDDEIPVQTRYNLPLEIFYTLAPVILIVPFFVHTVKIQDDVTALSDNPDRVIKVVGQQWSWTFNYTDEPVAEGRNVYEVGTASYIPTLVLPVDETIRFELHSPDVIHSFWITGFLYKEDVIPGRTNMFEVTPNVEGDYFGKCAELCGASHARMLFKVRVVSAQEYEEYLQSQIDKGLVSDEPLLGQDYTRTQAGLDGEPEGADK